MEHPKHILNRLNIRPKKSWGQNFLVHENNVQQILNAADIPPKAFVIEIGPGLGAMTEKLVSQVATYTGIEYDPILYEHLQNTYASSTATFIHKDILDVNLANVIGTQDVVVVGNLPYHITTPILEKLLSFHGQITSMTFLLQKEVVARMAAREGSKTYGRMSVWIQSMCDVTLGPVLKPGCFLPKPDVDSQVIHLIPKPEPADKRFLHFVGLLFQKRRKTLRRILKDLSYDVAQMDTDILDARPEVLKIEDLRDLWKLVQDQESL